MMAGELNKRVELLAPQAVADGYRQRVPTTPKSLGKVWAKIVPAGGAEYRRGEQTVDESTHAITIRYRRDFEPVHQVRYRGRLLEVISAVNRDERGEWLILQCKETK